MQLSQSVFSSGDLPHFNHSPQHQENQLVLLFGSTITFGNSANFAAVRSAFPAALIVGCSTAGEIHGTTVTDETLVATVATFEHTRLFLATADIDDMSQSFTAGQTIAKSLPQEDLVHVLIFSDGLKVNGTKLVRGLKENLPKHVEVTGGLSADGANFQKTLVCANDVPAEGKIVAVGFYGKKLKISYGSLGGWDSFGPEREVTRSEGNVLFDLDGKPALELYKHYLGEYATDLPASALLFPLSLRPAENGAAPSGGSAGVVRTILAVNESDHSMTFAGDVPKGSYVRLMKANFDRLIDGASGAAKICTASTSEHRAELALLISCVGRKLVLKQRIEEEIEGVRDVFGDNTLLAGFYSYGEISPHNQGESCELHNQTMTITTFCET